MAQYIEVHAGLRGHPKTKRLMRRLGISSIVAQSHLVAFWVWVMEYRPNGDLTSLEDEDIAQGAGWEGDPALFVDALLTCSYGTGCGFIERVGTAFFVHDWHEYGGKVVYNRFCDAFRKREKRGPSHAEITAANLFPVAMLRLSTLDSDKNPTDSSGIRPESDRNPSDSSVEERRGEETSGAKRSTEEKKKEEPSGEERRGEGASASPSSKPEKGTRLHDDWLPSTSAIAWAEAKYPEIDTNLVTTSFILYWTAVPGAKGLKLDWDKTWQNNVIECVGRGKFRKNADSTPARYTNGFRNDYQSREASALQSTARTAAAGLACGMLEEG